MHKHLKAKPKHVHDIEYSSSSTDFLRHIIRDHEYAMIFLVNEVVTCNKILRSIIQDIQNMKDFIRKPE